MLLAVQSQDAPLVRWSLAMRSRDATHADVVAAIDSGRIVRTHVLRPTWHQVLAEDLRWLRDLTGRKIAAGLKARHRGLRLDEPREVERGHAAVADRLRGGRHLTRRELAAELDDPGLTGGRLGHLLMLAELDGLICGGPLQRGRHTYALTDEWLPPTAPRPRDEAVRALVRRFFAGHGPASVAHLVRWSTLTRAETKQSLAELGDELDTLDRDDAPHWFDPATHARARRREHAFLLLPVSTRPTFPSRAAWSRGCPPTRLRPSRTRSPSRAAGSSSATAGTRAGGSAARSATRPR